MWENFLVVERLWQYANRGEAVRSRLWRAYGGAENIVQDHGRTCGQEISLQR